MQIEVTKSKFAIMTLKEAWANANLRHILLKDNFQDQEKLSEINFEQLHERLMYVKTIAVMQVGDCKTNTKTEKKIRKLAQISVQEIKQNLIPEYRLFYMFGKPL